MQCNTNERKSGRGIDDVCSARGPTGRHSSRVVYVSCNGPRGRERERGAPRTDKERCMKRPAKSSLLPESRMDRESRQRGQARFALATAASGLFSSGDLFRVFREDSDFSHAESSEGVSCSDPESFSSSSSFLSFLLTLPWGHVSPPPHPASCDTEKKLDCFCTAGFFSS